MHLDYHSPIRNFGESLTLSALEPEACRELIVAPMAAMNIGYADEASVARIAEQTGGRANLIQMTCNEMVKRLGDRRAIESGDVDAAFDSEAVRNALDAWGQFSGEPRAAAIDRMIVYATVAKDRFAMNDVIDALRQNGLALGPEELRHSLQRLELAFIIREEAGVYRWCVPLLRARRQREEPLTVRW